MTQPRRRPSDTLLALLGAYLLLSCLFLWQAWRRETPTIFTDELEMTQLSRSIAETGEAARRGVPLGFTTLVPWLTAPFWWIDDVGTAYGAIKYFQSLVMAAALFPAYALARFAVAPRWALFAAVASIATPALSYAPFLVEEPFAYPAATLALWLTIRAVHKPTRRTLGLAATAAVLGMLVRSQLLALPAILLLAMVVVLWRTTAFGEWRASWSRGDWVGAIALGVGAFFLATAVVGHQSADWAEATSAYPEKIFTYGTWAAGGFAISVGFMPAIALLAILVPPPREWVDPRMRAFVVVAAASVATFGWYAAIKGAYVSAHLSGEVVERNLIYLVPMAMGALAATLERRAARPGAILAATGVVLGFVLAVPIDKGVDQFPYYEAHGLAILALLNRELAWPTDQIERALVAAVLTCGSLLLLRTVARNAQSVKALCTGLALATIAWGITNEIYAAVGERDFSSRVAANLPRPFNWVDEATGGARSTILTQTVRDILGLNSAEFWNRSIIQVWSLDGSAPGPGGTVTPDLANPDGTLTPNPGTPFVLETNGVDLAGTQVASMVGMSVVQVGHSFRLRASQVGVEGDGWFTSKGPDELAKAAYNRFDIAGDGSSLALVRLSREAFCPRRALPAVPGLMQVRIGVVGVGNDKQPAITRVTGSTAVYVPSCGSRTIAFPAPRQPWRIEIAGQTFVPNEIAPKASSDRRHLAARVEFDVVPRSDPS